MKLNSGPVRTVLPRTWESTNLRVMWVKIKRAARRAMRKTSATASDELRDELPEYPALADSDDDEGEYYT